MENEKIDTLQLLAYLRGEKISSQEAETVENWLREKKNIEIAKTIYKTWELSALASSNSIDKEKAWNSIKSKLEIKSRDQKNNSVIWPTIRIAAGLLILSVIGLYLYYNNSIQQKPLIFQSENAKLEIVTPDKSLVVLNKNTKVTYIENDETRIVNLIGEAYFDVEAKKDLPFVIRVSNYQLKVLGTKFLVKTLPDSTIQVVVTEGRVSVTDLNSGETLIVSSNQELFINKNVKLNESNENDLYWVTEILKFENEPLGNVLRILSEEFNVNIEVSNPAILNCRTSATFKKQSLETILDIINKTHSLKVSKNNNSYVITGEGCHD